MAMIINERKNTVVMTKKDAKAASIFNSPEYKDLQEIRKAYPNIRVEVRATSKRKTTKGLTFEFMKEYILKHDDENHSKMKMFEDLTATSAEAMGLNMTSKSYGEVKKWFLETFDEFQTFEDKRDALLKAIA